MTFHWLPKAMQFFQNGIYPERKKNCSQGANSFLYELTPLRGEAKRKTVPIYLNPLYTGPGKLFHCNMLDNSICSFSGVGSILLLLFYFQQKILLANTVDPDRMPHYVASDLGLHCFPIYL